MLSSEQKSLTNKLDIKHLDSKLVAEQSTVKSKQKKFDKKSFSNANDFDLPETTVSGVKSKCSLLTLTGSEPNSKREFRYEGSITQDFEKREKASSDPTFNQAVRKQSRTFTNLLESSLDNLVSKID